MIQQRGEENQKLMAAVAGADVTCRIVNVALNTCVIAMRQSPHATSPQG
jgi:hypothetical protein